MSKIPYALAIGSIMYGMICTRPDVAHALSVTSRYQSNPGEEHWKAVKNILKYLRRTKDGFLVYGVDSVTEAEYIAASETAKEVVWMKKFITELGVIPSIRGAVPLFCNDTGAVV